ncbi:NAD(P)/FAD-dependent oxidoreductase [Niallia nealsonii]|uniref:FAD-binding oxidoreductase n=1 Tax=Niallia nealsonii TaxID=115979 RepID=A0A2N0YY97_9BACI|nr:FAD-dependent oxidoreductase [Niallia nealsonii]PKG22234.1 FAD-binding oxidoreductase [Niallia nealsonii]
MDLYKGSLYWPTTLANLEVPEYPILNKEVICDCLVIGGGMSGALCSYLLADESLDIILVDKRKVSTGSSSANTGLLQYANDKMLHEFAESIGEEKAVRFYKLCYEAMKKLQAVAESLDSDVQFQSRKSLYYATDKNDVEKLQKEYNLLKKHGFDAEYLIEEEIEKIYGFKKPAAILTTGDAEINPQMFVRELIKEAHQKNVQVFEHTKVTEEGFHNGYWKFTSDNGVIYAKKVIYSTGYEGINFAKKEGGELNRTYAIATSPLPEFSMWKDQCLIWETKRPYFYMRTTFDGRIVAGGLDEDQVEAPSDPEILARYGDNLLKRIKDHFPGYQVEADYVYGATFGESDDGMPYIGEHPEKKNIFYCLGYGGNGTVYSMFGAEILKDLIIYGNHPDWDLVRLDR